MDMMQQTVKSLGLSLQRREVSARELCEEALELIEALNPDLKALVTVTEDAALSLADNAQKLIDARQGTALTGIPAVVNDNIMTKDIVTTCGSKMLADFIPPFDAAAIELLTEAGYVLLGKTVMSEFNIGGSPKSGAAVSAGFAPYSLSMDTGGALRRSAALHGLTGLRPTYGRVSRHGLGALASSLDQIGPIAQTAEDCALILNIIAKKDTRDMTSFGNPKNEDFTAKIGAGVKGLKIAIPKEFFTENISDETKSNIMQAAKELEAQGAVLVDISSKIPDYAAEIFCIISAAEASSNLSRYDGVNYGLRGEGNTYAERIIDSRNRGFGSEVKRRILFGNFVLSQENYDEYYKKALALRQKIRADYDEIFKAADVVLTPTISDEIEKDTPAKRFLADFCTSAPSLAGLPSISTSSGYRADGIPIGMLITGRLKDEQTVLQVADCYERILNPDLFEVNE